MHPPDLAWTSARGNIVPTLPTRPIRGLGSSAGRRQALTQIAASCRCCIARGASYNPGFAGNPGERPHSASVLGAPPSTGPPMAQHKAPTAVTVAPLVEKTGLGLWIARHWIHAGLISVAIIVAIIWRDRMSGQEAAAQQESWAKLNSKIERDSSTGVYAGDPAALAALAVELKDTAAGPPARFVEVVSRLGDRDYAGALHALDALERESPQHALVGGEYMQGEKLLTLAQSLRKSIENLQEFDASHAGLLASPDPAPDAPRVRLITDRGPIVVALYDQRAPKHTANFLKLCGEGFYNTTKFHRSVPGFMIQAGDPNSKVGAPATWGLGGPGYKVDAEPSAELFHFKGMLAMAKNTGDSQSSGSQFYITAAPAHSIDGQYTIFGKVVEGMEIVDQINAAPNEPNTDRPLAPVVISETQIL